ncbi:nuclear transport factor 2 family protein [Thalassotalea sp. PLHSN55]|uniref:nuclear transport factor 2 family protein n=1 Tax=Thalassotalea sp. PLHSN55 TaxID=3435888 RepID=UPI003F843F1A
MADIYSISSESANLDSPQWLTHFIGVYQNLSTDNLDSLAQVYHQDVIFSDPLHNIEGFVNLYDYFIGLYSNLISCSFDIQQVIKQDSHAAIYWKMRYQHPKLNKGQVIVVEGHSHIQGAGNKVIYHRDYLDVGAMLYEQLPIFGSLTRWLKNKIVKQTAASHASVNKVSAEKSQAKSQNNVSGV